ncbi:MAG: hypothetical protein IJZ63_02210, partial [Clostridia bacterium]|nr:hypothetical protein [Clostridia bacterium]
MFEKIRSEFLIGKALVKQNAFDGRAFSLDFKQTKDSIKGVLTAKCDLDMKSFEIECEKDFEDDD